MKFRVECELPDEWAKSFISMLMDMNRLGEIERSAIVGLFVDGSNGLKPDFRVLLMDEDADSNMALPYGVHIKTHSEAGELYYHSAIVHRPTEEWANTDWKSPDDLLSKKRSRVTPDRKIGKIQELDIQELNEDSDIS